MGPGFFECLKLRNVIAFFRPQIRKKGYYIQYGIKGTLHEI